MPDTTRPPALLRLPVFALSHLGRAARGAVRGAFSRAGLSGRAHFVLVCLHEYGQLSQRELADLIAMDRSDLVKLLDTLERDGQVSRAVDAADRRRHVLSITPAGTATMRRGEDVMGEATDALLHRLTADERATLHALILRAIDLPEIQATRPAGDL
jgi:MarR family transcriptional regulator, lower aerobic nicotinate degradation pathway regulator